MSTPPSFITQETTADLIPPQGGSSPKIEEGVKEPTNSELKKIATDILGALKYSFVSVAANPDTNVRSNTVEAAVKTYIKGLDAEKTTNYIKVSKSLVEAKETVRIATFGRAGKRSAAEHLGIAGGLTNYDASLPPLEINQGLLGVKVPELTVSRENLTDTPEGLLIRRELMENFDFESINDKQSDDQTGLEDEIMDRTRLQDIWGTFGADEQLNQDSDFESTTTDKIGLWITKVKCVDETNPERGLFINYHDEIAIGGQSIDEDGQVKRINETRVGGGFDDGDEKIYNPHWRFHYFGLHEGSHWPKSYRVIMMLAEKDSGGFQSLLNTVYSQVREKVEEAVKKGVTDALTSYLGPVIARVLGEMAAWIVDQVISFIIDLFGDDVFPAYIASVTTPSMSARWHFNIFGRNWPSVRSPIQIANFYGHKGHYRVEYYWKFFS